MGCSRPVGCSPETSSRKFNLENALYLKEFNLEKENLSKTLKEEEREAMQAMSFNLDMPMIPFEEVYTIQHITHRFNPDGNMPILTLISNSGRVLLADGITDLQDSMD